MDVKMIKNKGEGSTKWTETPDLLPASLNVGNQMVWAFDAMHKEQTAQTMTYSREKELSLTPNKSLDITMHLQEIQG